MADILTITEPTLSGYELDEFAIPDIESGNDGGEQSRDKLKDKASKYVGDTYPAIKINEYQFNAVDIRNFRMEVGGFLPTLRVSIVDTRGVFSISQYPKDGDVLSLWIRSRAEDIFKPIRMDFDITKVTASLASKAEQSLSAAPGAQGPDEAGLRPQTFSFECRAKIPLLYSEECFAYEEGSSFEHAERIATELGLGFASNVSGTSDSMVRICPFDTRRKFIEDLTKSSYSDDNKFFDVFIDQYYYLNMVDLNQQYQYSPEVQDTVITLTKDLGADKDYSDIGTMDGKLYLTNVEKGHVGTSQYIDRFAPLNNAGKIFLKNGYKRSVQYFDAESREYVDFTVDPLTSENLPDDLFPLRGRSDEDLYQKYIKYKFTGSQSENTHENFHFAHIHNYQNKVSLDKMQLCVELPTANMGLYRYQRIPVLIYETDTKRTQVIEQRRDLAAEQNIGRSEDLNESDTDRSQYGAPKLNDFYTGVYVISKIEYIYKAGYDTIRQKLILNRREWRNPI